MCNTRGFYRLRELYEADFHKLGIDGSGRVWVNVWDVFHSMSCRVGRGRQAAVDFMLCFGWGGIFRVFFFDLFCVRTHTACCKYEVTLPHLPHY